MQSEPGERSKPGPGQGSPGRPDGRKGRRAVNCSTAGRSGTTLFAPFSRAFSRFERSENYSEARILAPNFLTFMSNPNLDLRHPLTIFDETADYEKVRRPRRTQEDLGALWAGRRPPVRTEGD